MTYKDPDQQGASKRAWARMRGAGESGTPSGPLLSASFRLKTAADVLALLEEQIGAVRNDPEAGTLEWARVVGYLATGALKAIEASHLVARIESLEVVLEVSEFRTRLGSG